MRHICFLKTKYALKCVCSYRAFFTFSCQGHLYLLCPDQFLNYYLPFLSGKKMKMFRFTLTISYVYNFFLSLSCYLSGLIPWWEIYGNWQWYFLNFFFWARVKFVHNLVFMFLGKNFSLLEINFCWLNYLQLKILIKSGIKL